MSRIVIGVGVACLVATAGYAQPAPDVRGRATPAAGLHLAFESLDPRLQGNGWLVPGVRGQALQLDGIAAHVRIPARDVPPLPGSFTVSGWVALGAYPFNDAPLLQQQDGESAGWFFGVGDRGQVRFDVVAGAGRIQVISPVRLPLRQWAFVAGVFERGKGATLYVNGEVAGRVEETGAFAQATGSDLWIGRNAMELEQSAAVGAGRQRSTRIVLDGILDELKLESGATSAQAIESAYARQKPVGAPPLEARALPTLPGRPAPFGAFCPRATRDAPRALVAHAPQLEPADDDARHDHEGAPRGDERQGRRRTGLAGAFMGSACPDDDRNARRLWRHV